MPGFSSLLDLEKAPLARPYTESGYDLVRYRAWVDKLGAPDREGAFLHIAGTKGKGSTAAMCEAILRASGHTTGMYTSPHLSHYRERFRVAGVPLSADEFVEACARLDAIIPPEADVPSKSAGDFRTVFEYLTALALFEFRRADASAVIWETGLGGRLDCTNIADPVVSVITAIGMDHTRILGGTIGEIAREKAGIIKAGRPVIVQRQPCPEAFDVVAKRAVEVGAELIRAESLFQVESGRDTPQGREIRIATPEGERELGLPLLGSHQDRNVETALAACWTFEGERKRTRSVSRFLEGAERASWPGRLEIVRARDASRTLLLDGAHCPLSARALGATLAAWEASDSSPARGPWRLLLGMQADKDIAGFVRTLMESARPARIECVACYEVPGGRGATPQVVTEAVRSLGLAATEHDSPETALQYSSAQAGGVLAAGTLYTLARIREHWIGVWG